MNTENTDIDAETTDSSKAPDPDSSPNEPVKAETPPQAESASRAERSETPDYSQKPPRRGGFLVFLALLFSLAALAGSAWMWWQDQSSRDSGETRLMNEISRLESNDSQVELKLKQLRDELDALASGDVSAEFNALQVRLQADRAQAESLEQAMREQLALSRSLQAATDSIQGRLQAAEAAVSGLSTRELDAGGELDLAEVDYLLRLANERVKLFADPEAADQALEVADMHLAALDNPMYLGVRQDIATARRELAAVETPDFLAIATQLDEVQETVAVLSFRDDDAATTPVDVAAEGDEGWCAKIKGAFSGLVTVRRSTEEENQRISLQDKDFIRQRIWLQLEVAHLALMRREQPAFRQSLQRARNAIERWFEPNGAAYREVIAALDGLATVAIEVWTRPCDSVFGTRCTRCGPASNLKRE